MGEMRTAGIILVMLALWLASGTGWAQMQVAIFRDDIPSQGAASDPEHLASLISAAGFSVTFLNSEQMADPALLDAKRTRVVILPYGASFPLKAAENFRRFLREGGDFISVGGYAFDRLMARDAGGKWVRQENAPWAEVDIGGDFEGGLRTWKTTGRIKPHVREKEGRSGGKCAFVQVAGKPGTAEFYLDLEPRAGCEYEFSGWMKAQIGSMDGYAFLAWYQYDEQGKILEWRDIALQRGAGDRQPGPWRRYEWKFTAAAGATRLRLRAGIYDGTGRAWFDDLRLRARPATVPMNTRQGTPADGLQVKPEQIGVFDPSYPLERVCSAAGTGFIFPKTAQVKAKLTGWAASAVVGWDEGRWLPLINAYDRYGRLRGAAGALVRHHGGLYRGSQWAVFGVDNADLFAPGSPFAERLVDLLRVMEKETFISRLTTDFAHYKPGEPVKVKVELVNQSPARRECTVQVRLCCIGADGGESEHGGRGFLERIEPGGTAVWEWAERLPQDVHAGRWRVEATLRVDGLLVDRAETGFTTDTPLDPVQGPQFEFKDNYIRIGGRQHLWTGTDTGWPIIWAAQQNPLTLDRHLRTARDFGIIVWETLLNDPRSYPQPYLMSEEHARRFEAIARLTQRHSMVWLPGLLIGFDVCASEQELAKQAGYLRQFAQRFAGTRAMMYYINGDLAWRGDSEELRRLYLRQHPGPKLEPRPRASAWNDMAAVRWERYAAWLTRRWLAAHHKALREADPGHPTTVEFYREPFGAVDLRAGLGPVNLGNIGYFGLPGRDIQELPARLKFSDMRATGQGMSVGEFGVKTHPAWQGPYDYHTTRTRDQQFDLFLAVTHYALGLGACKVHNWCWDDQPHWIFPWGLVHAPDGVPKDALRLYRNVGLLFRMFEPVYRAPEAYLVSPESNRLGPGGDRITRAVFNSARALISLGVQFGVVNEEDLGVLPQSARLLVYPVPYCPPDGVIEELVRRVKAGASLYFSGDISFSSERRRDREGRLRKLAGVELVDAPADPLEALRRSPQVSMVSPAVSRAKCAGFDYYHRSLGRGTVVYCPRPVELEGDEAAVKIAYGHALRLAGRRGLMATVSSGSEEVDRFEVPVKSGRAFVFFNRGEKDGWAGAGQVSVGVGPHKAGLILFDAQGRLIAVEGSGACRKARQLLIRCPGHFIAASLDGADLSESGAVLLMSTKAGNVQAASFAGRAAQVGEVRAGRWAALETFAVARDGVIEIDEDRALEMIVIAPADQLDRWGRKAASLLASP